MIDPITVATTLISVAKTIQTVTKFLDDLRAAPEEFKTMARHVELFTLVLKNVQSDLSNNTRSIFSKTQRRSELARLVNACEKSIDKAERLFKIYGGMQDLRNQLRWRNKGKHAANSIIADLVIQTQMVSLFLHTESLECMWKMELAVEEIAKDMKTFKILLERMANGVPMPKVPNNGHNTKTVQPKRTPIIDHPNIGRTLFASLFISRLTAKLHAMREAKQQIRVKKGVKPVVKPKRMNSLQTDYARKLAGQRGDSRKRLECWLVTEGQYAFGGRAIHAGRQQMKRGQVQLAEMVNLFQAGATGSSSAVDGKHSAVKWILSRRNEKNTGHQWSLAAARIGSRSASDHGTIQFEKVLVILKRSV